MSGRITAFCCCVVLFAVVLFHGIRVLNLEIKAEFGLILIFTREKSKRKIIKSILYVVPPPHNPELTRWFKSLCDCLRRR